MSNFDISMAKHRSGTRLAYVVVPLEGTVMRPQMEVEEKKIGRDKHGNPLFSHTMKQVMKEEPAGFMVYFPRGHAIRIRSRAELAEYNLETDDIPMVSLTGLNDPKSEIGKLLSAQDDRGRKTAWESLENKTIRLATARTGTVLMPEQTGHGFRLNEDQMEAVAL